MTTGVDVLWLGKLSQVKSSHARVLYVSPPLRRLSHPQLARHPLECEAEPMAEPRGVPIGDLASVGVSALGCRARCRVLGSGICPSRLGLIHLSVGRSVDREGAPRIFHETSECSSGQCRLPSVKPTVQTAAREKRAPSQAAAGIREATLESKNGAPRKA